MDDLPTDILLHELGYFLYPFERFKLCGCCKYFNRIFSIHNFKFNHSHYQYDNNYFTKFLQKYLHSGTCNLSNNLIFELNKNQLQHLKYFIIYHNELYKIYKLLLKLTPKHYQSLSYTPIISSSSTNTLHKKTHSMINLIESPFLKALQCINCIDLQKCASSFAIKPYNIKFICDIIQFGFNVNKSNKSNESNIYKSHKGLSLKLSSNNLNTSHILLICQALKNRNKNIDLYSLNLGLNHNISDLCVKILFKNIGNKCNNLKLIDLSYANITDISCDVIYNFYHKYFINNCKNKNKTKLHKIDLSFTRISDNGFLILDTLFNELPKSIKYIHNKHDIKNKSKIIQNIKYKNKSHNNNNNTGKSQAFEIVLKGCFFESYLCKNYICPKLQTYCCIKTDP